MDTFSEAHRRACEARHWLREGYRTPGSVGELIERIRAQRGAAAAADLHAEMRAQWNVRDTWLDDGAAQ